MNVAPSTTDGASRRALEDELTGLLGGARHEARFIVEEVLSPGKATDSLPPRVPSAAVDSARSMAHRRAEGEPLQYLFGHWPFRTLDLLVTPQVLIPRPETEQVTDVALVELRRLGVARPVIVDVGTGSGAIALALAAECAPTATVWATDASADALVVAAANLERVRRAAGGAGALCPVEFAEGSWLEPLPASLRHRISLVVSNPPYVAEAEWEGLPADVRAEPRRALVAGTGSEGTPGLAGVEAVLAQARGWLSSPAAVVIELAPHQAAPAAALARALGYGDVRVEPDLTGRDRALVARAG